MALIGAAEPRRLGRDDEGRKRDSGIDGCIEERVEVIVGERLAAPRVQLPLPAVVAAEHEERRGARDPVLRQRAGREQRVDARSDSPVLDDDDVALLHVALGRGGQRQRAQRLDQLGGDRRSRK